MKFIYEYLIESPGLFIVIKRWKDKEGKPRVTEYYVSYKKGKWMCDPKCKGFWMNKNRDKRKTAAILSQRNGPEWSFMVLSPDIQLFLCGTAKVNRER